MATDKVQRSLRPDREAGGQPMSAHASDTARLYELLQERGETGVHTSEIRRMGISGNPSQRATDAEQRYGCTIDREIEWWSDETGKRRNGSRFTLRRPDLGLDGNQVSIFDVLEAVDA